MGSTEKTMSMFEAVITGVVVIALILFVGLRIMAELRTQGDNTAEINTAMDELIAAIGTIPGWIVILIVVVIGGAMIFLLRSGFKGDGY